jgi:rubrerythrin
MNPLTEKQQKLFSLFEVAIDEERKAQELYSNMLRRVEEPFLQIILESLIQQERCSQSTHSEPAGRII